MSAETLVTTTLDSSVLPDPAAWASEVSAKLPAGLARLATDGAFKNPDAESSAYAAKCAAALRLRSAYVREAPTATKLPVSYRTVPGPLRRLIGDVIGRVQRRRQASWADFPGWPLDLSADLAADLAGISPVNPDTPTPVIVSHDIDSGEGLENLVSMFLPIEESLGARSANYVVPFAWTLDHGLIRETLDRGHEIGVHGYDHSGRTPFAGADERTDRLSRGHDFGCGYGAVGYRAPSLMRTEALVRDLAPLYRYDSSIPTSGGPFPVPNNGCASARPWRIHGRLWELPLSLPRDGSLRFLGHSADEISQIWLECADRIRRSRGVVVLLTHCEQGFSGNPSMLQAYGRFLEAIAADGRYKFTLPRDYFAEQAED